MIVDIRKLHHDKKLSISGEVSYDKEYYEKMDILSLTPISVNGDLSINYEDEIMLKCQIKGTFTMPCCVSLEAVEIPFEAEVEQIIDEKDLKSQINLDLFDILWENVVLEVPIKVTKEGITNKHTKGEGWELES